MALMGASKSAKELSASVGTVRATSTKQTENHLGAASPTSFIWSISEPKLFFVIKTGWWLSSN